ncbi:hypothetical protein ASPVEDRAFT_149770 [Aspergillus versicolor CBS 583.65]|uniref:RNase III domain-containing protein n=1 Tax=Aspergillus versicolor CBS 583.65 TaxID=1036611 RepID=A0A1L9PH86_ASPVE|nr:uncharacterized protein ASPVEDRAFT_149770 [Aspergillus versicolor CBS 583.65]OJJ00868.1 hypothetical protein ASPVEDRAFT_149770 [Aspergillus versicolor CBS 583.65]
MVAVLLDGPYPIYSHVQYHAVLLWHSESDEYDRFEILFNLGAVTQNTQKICHSATGAETSICKDMIHRDVTSKPGTQRTEKRRQRRKKCQMYTPPPVQEIGDKQHVSVVPDKTSYPSPRLPQSMHETSTCPSTVRVPDQFDPWAHWARAWPSTDTLYQTRICIQAKGNPDAGVFVNMIMPVACSSILTPINISCDTETEFRLSFAEMGSICRPGTELMNTMRQITALYVGSSKGRHQDNRQDFLVLLVPDQPDCTLDCWLNGNSGSESAIQVHARGVEPASIGIVHDSLRFNKPLIFSKWVPSPTGSTQGLMMECEQLSSLRRQFCRNPDEDLLPPVAARSTVVSAQACTVDRLPFGQSIFGLSMPALLDTLERRLIAARLCDTILGGIQFETIDHVVTALTTPYARPRSNYQRYEFFGDSVLKHLISCQVFFQNSHWQEHDLTRARDKLVQNDRLTRAAMRIGLGAYIIDRRTSLRRYAVPFISQRSQRVPKERSISSKALADVIEALIGAAYVDGGLSRAHQCIRRLLPEIGLQSTSPSSFLRPRLHPIPEHGVDHILKGSLGYTFRNETLLEEALTHPSCGHHSTTASYQRLEFLGDAVLDMVTVDHFIRHSAEIPQGQMTLIKHAVCNGNLLAFFCLENGLWRFMRFKNPIVKISQDTIFNRYLGLRDQVCLSLERGSQYPWQDLGELNPDKHFSDVIESILGAIFVDSGGDIPACGMFLERIGWTRYLQRILDVGVDVMHPKNALQMLSKSLAICHITRSKNKASEATYDCAVSIRDTQIAIVSGCSCRTEAEVKASNAALEILQHTTLDSLIS